MLYGFSKVTISITISHKAYEQWVFRDKNLFRKADSQGGEGLEQNCPQISSDMLSNYVFHPVIHRKTVRKTHRIFLHYRYRSLLWKILQRWWYDTQESHFL